MTTMLLAQDFPPMGGGIARLHGELARHFPPGELIVSTPSDPDAAEVDADLGGVVDRLPIPARRTKTLAGLLFWSRRAASLARQRRVSFVHCGNVKPAGYPARWVFERCRVPYGIYLHGSDLLSEQHKIRQSAFKGRTAKVIFGGAAVLMANSTWTRDLALALLGELGLDGHGERLRVVHLGTDPGRFRQGVETSALRERTGLPNSTRWLVTVARLQRHKGIDTVIQALPAVLARAPDVGYVVAGSGPAREHLETLAQKVGVADRVHFLGRWRDGPAGAAGGSRRARRRRLPSARRPRPRGAARAERAARRRDLLQLGPRRPRPARHRG